VKCAIVLAGGASRRFGSDKLVADLDGEPLLAATLERVARVVDRIIVAGTGLPRDAASGGSIVLIADPRPAAGPLVALDHVLRAARLDPDDSAIVVGGDMPRLVPAVLRLMLDVLDEDHDTPAVILDADDGGPKGDRAPRRAVLPLAVRVGAARLASAAAVGSGEHSLQALVDRLGVTTLPAARWQPLDPDARTLLDVDTRSDLERIRADGR
jgi:molybdenum cofactor guanylyltransferase